MNLKPPPLERIAEAIRDRELLDIKALDIGTAVRVLPVNVTVWADHDDVAFTQEFLRDGDFRSRDFTLDAEDIMWMRPTIHGLSDVEPAGLPTQGPLPPNDEMVKIVTDAVAFTYNMNPEMVHDHRQSTPEVRYAAMAILWETTDLSHTAITRVFGYQSPTPFFSARNDMKRKDDLRRRTRAVFDLVQQRVGREIPFRRANQESILYRTEARY